MESSPESQRSTLADSEFGFFKHYSKASSARVLKQQCSMNLSTRTHSSDARQRNHMYESFLVKTHTDVTINFGTNLKFHAHRIVLDSGSSFFNKKFKNWWRQNQNEPGHEDKDGSDGLCVDLKNDVECLFGKIGDVYQEYEVRDVLDSIFKYFYTSEIDLEIVDFEEWLCLVRVADYFAMDTLILLLTDHFKSAFLIADTEIISNFQACLSYPFLHDLCTDIGDFISSNLSKICESIRNLADEAANTTDFSTDEFDCFEKLPLATHESTLFFDDQVVPNHVPEVRTQRVVPEPAEFHPELACGDSKSMKTEVEDGKAEISANEEVIVEERKHALEIHLGQIKYSTIFKILENNPNAEDETIFHFIVSWFSSKSQTVETKPITKRAKLCKKFLKSPTIKTEELQILVIEQAITLLERFIQKEFDGSSRTKDQIIQDLSIMKRQQGETDEQVFRHRIFDSPPKTPVKKHSLAYFTDEVQNNPCYKMWLEKGTESFRNYNKQKDMILAAWLGVPESPSMALSSFSFFQTSTKRITRAKRKLVMDEIKANTSFEIKEALVKECLVNNDGYTVELDESAKNSSTSKVKSESGTETLKTVKSNAKPAKNTLKLNNFTEIKPVKYRVPYQAPLVVGSWAGKDDKDDNYGPSSNAHIWNHSKDEWTTNPESFKMPGNICYNGTAYIEPFLYIYGGYDGNRENSHGISEAWKCNMETLVWEAIAPINIRRLYIAGTSMGDHSVVAIGGSSGRNSKEIRDYMTETNDKSFINDSGRMRAVEQYLIKEKRWRRLPNMIEHRSDASACCHNNFLYVAGGFNGKSCLNSAEIYNPDEHLWTKLPNMFEKRSGLSLIIYQNNILAMCGFGGRNTNDNDEEGARPRKKRHKTVECLKLDDEGVLPDQKEWKLLPAKLGEGRSNFGACVINDNQIVVCGGFNDGTLKSCERWIGSIEKVASTRYSEYETEYERTKRQYRESGWHYINDLPVEMSAMSVLTIKSSSKPLYSTLSSCGETSFEVKNPDESTNLS